MLMRTSRWIVALAGLGCVLASGCYYKKPALRDWYAEIVPDMTRDQVVDIMGRPTREDKNSLMYVYDDPEDPARFLFVLDDNGVVIEKYYQPKTELEEKARQLRSQSTPVAPAPGEEPNRSYPGGPLPQFGKHTP